MIIPVCILLGVAVSIADCSKRDERKLERERIERLADSLRREEIEANARILREATEHRLTFYNKISSISSSFKTYESFNEWLSRANNAAFELLYAVYSERYHDFHGEDDLANYLYWGPPEYETYCDVCGNEITITDYE